MIRKALMQFKPGAFIPGAPVQPVLIKYHIPQHMVNKIALWIDCGPLLSLDFISLGHSDLDMGPTTWCSHVYISFSLSVEPQVKWKSGGDMTHKHILD